MPSSTACPEHTGPTHAATTDSLNAVQMAELHRKTPEQALADAQARVQIELDKYQR